MRSPRPRRCWGTATRFAPVRVLMLTCVVAAVLTGIVAGTTQAGLAQATQSRCATVTVSQHQVFVGQTITATAARGPGWTQTCGDTWSWVPWYTRGQILAGCQNGDRVCTIRTEQPGETHSPFYFSQWCVTNIGGPEWESCGLYIVLPRGPVIEGYVRYPNGTPVPGTYVEAVGTSGSAGSGTGGIAPLPAFADTTANGEYVLEVNPGTYRVTPTLRNSSGANVQATFSPSSADRTVSVAGSYTANFVLQCVGGCQLKVFVKQLEPLRSGLAVHSIHYKQAPVDFMGTTPPRQGAEIPEAVCESGCVDILVGVIDPKTHEPPAPYATVSATLGQLRLGSQELYGRLVTPPAFGSGFLCEPSGLGGRDQRCGTTLTGLRTDAKGQVHLRYWAPGVVADAHTTIGVTAACDVAPCQAGKTTSHTTLHVSPYLIYQHTREIPTDDLELMTGWAQGEKDFTSLLETSTKEYNLLHHALQLAEDDAKLAQHAKELLEPVEPVEPIVLITEIALQLNALNEAMGMFALFLENTGLSAIGIGQEPFEPSVSGNPTASFVHELINQLAVPSWPPGLKASDGGFWWASAEAVNKELLSEAREEHPALQEWSVGTEVYEVSHCDDKLGFCGPGYGSRPGSSQVTNAGIEPELVFELTLFRGTAELRDGLPVEHDGQPVFSDTPVVEHSFAMEYDADAWTTTQQGLRGVIQDFK